MTRAPSGADLAELITTVARALRYRPSSLPPHQFRALRAIERSPIRPARLADRLRITPRAVTDVVDALASNGLISASPDPADRRAKILTITEKGQQLVTELHERRAAAADEFFAGMPDHDRQALSDILGTLPPFRD